MIGKLQPAAAAVGNTPVLWIDEPAPEGGRGYWAKLEGFNFGGIKDRAALHMVERARARGELRPGAPVVESTSGTLGLGLALAGVHYGHPVHIVTDPGLEPIVERMLTAHGARVHVVREPGAVGGWQQARVDRVAALLERPEFAGAWCPNQYHNPDNPDAYQALAVELVRQLGQFDVLVCAVGTGGHSAGIARTLRARDLPGLELVGVDSLASTIFGLPAGPRLMRGLGSSIHPRNVDHAAFDEVHWVGPAEAVRSARRLAGRQFATGGWSVGAVALVAAWLARTRPRGTRIAAVFPDGPQRYFDTVFNDEYCRERGLLGGGGADAVPDEPREVGGPGDGIAEWSWWRTGRGTGRRTRTVPWAQAGLGAGGEGASSAEGVSRAAGSAAAGQVAEVAEVASGGEAAARAEVASKAAGSAAGQVASEGVVPEGAVPGGTTPEPRASEPAESEAAPAPAPAAPEPTVPEPTVPEPTVPEPTVPEPTASEPTASEPTGPRRGTAPAVAR